MKNTSSKNLVTGKLDFSIPQEGFVFPLDRDSFGSRLALIFGNEGGTCPHYNKQCLFCEIGAGEYDGHHFTANENKCRVDWFVSHYGEPALRSVKHLLLYNSGSVIDAKQISDRTLAFIAKKLLQYCEPSMVSIDTRAQFVTEARLQFLKDIFPDVSHLQFDIGLEVYNEEVRRNKLKKLIFIDDIEECCKKMQRQSLSLQFGLAINFIYGLPCWTIEQSLDDIESGISFFHTLSLKYSIPINFNIHPFQPNQKSRLYFPGASPPQETDLALLFDFLEKKSLSMGREHLFYVGLNDEGLNMGKKAGLSAELLERVINFNFKGGI